MTITITAFAQSPDRGRGLARDTPVRWALEEAGLAYDVRLETFAQLKQPPHLAVHPFGQIPTYEEDGLALFESGAIVLHIAQKHGGGLLPDDPQARARAIAWMFAAVATVQAPIVEREGAVLTERDQPYHAQRMPMLDGRVTSRLTQLSDSLGDKAWLDGAFSAADILMVNVLRRLGTSGLLNAYPSLQAYIDRGEARPAFQRAYAAQKAVFENLPKG
jgi:glutathione S-transferase